MRDDGLRDRNTVRGMTVLRATLAALPTLGRLVALMLLAATIGTNLLDFASMPASGARPTVPFLAAAIVRVVLVFWIAYAVQRRLTATPCPFAVQPSFWRFCVLEVVLFVGFGICVKLALMAAGTSPPLATEWLASFLALALWSLATIRTLAWVAALGAGAPFAALPRLWRAQTGMDLALIGAFCALVLPPAAIHLALTLVGLKVPLPPKPKLALLLCDGMVQALQLAFTCALAAVAWRIARSVEGAGHAG